jgi:hypothetical protein
MAGRARSILLTAVTASIMTLGTTVATAAPAAAGLPEEGCDLVDQRQVERLLGVATEAPAAESVQDGIGCSIAIPYDAATCVVQPEPVVLVGARKDKPDLAQLGTQVSDGGYEVQRLKGKAYGKKGAFVAAINGWTFFGAEGPYAIQVQAYDPCGSVPDEKLEATAKALAKRVVKQV